MSNVIVETYINGALRENCYFFHRDKQVEGIIVDPGYDIDYIRKKLDANNFVIKAILLTHGHFDHIIGANSIREESNVDIYISNDDNELLLDAKKNLSNVFFKEDSVVKNAKLFNDGDILKILDFNIKCIITKGHTKGSACFYLENENIMFTGDTLFKNTFGRTDLYSGDVESMYNSLNNILFNMGDDILCYPGHGEITTIGYEKTHNEIFSYIDNLNNLYKV